MKFKPFGPVVKIRLLVDIDDDYYNIHFKKGEIVESYPFYEIGNDDSDLNKNRVISVNGHGAYTYAESGAI